MERFTTFDGIEIAYERHGDVVPSVDASPDELPPVLLHHGFIADGNLNWVLPGTVPALLAAGRSAITIDARGHGQSDKPHDRSYYGESKMAQDLDALVTVLGLTSVDLVGYSMGGVTSLIAAATYPWVRRLVVGGIGSGVVECGGVDTRALPRTIVAESLLADDASAYPGPEGDFRRFVDALGGDRFALAAQAQSVHNTPIALDRITAPTLLIAGEDDPLATEPQKLVDAIPDAELLVVSGDHMNALGDPRFIPAIVDFVGAPA